MPRLQADQLATADNILKSELVRNASDLPPSVRTGISMNRFTFILLTGLLSLLHGCSNETVKRTSFETLQNLREQQCEKDLSGNCPAREHYSDYQRKRREAQAPEDRDMAAPASLGNTQPANDSN